MTIPITKDNIFLYLQKNIIDKNKIEEIVNYDIINNYGYLILNNFGSNYYNELKKNIINKYIITLSKDELIKIINYDILITHKNETRVLFASLHLLQALSNQTFSKNPNSILAFQHHSIVSEFQTILLRTSHVLLRLSQFL